MTKPMKQTLLLSAGFLTLFLLPSTSRAADCYTDCIQSANCTSLSSGYDSAYCSDTQASCAVNCQIENEKRGKSYGSIAYSSKNGAYGYSDGMKDRRAAEKSAVKFCKQHGSGCRSRVWFYNSCGAVAADGNKVTWGQASTRQAAMQQALDKCKGFFRRHCEVKAYNCSGV